MVVQSTSPFDVHGCCERMICLGRVAFQTSMFRTDVCINLLVVDSAGMIQRFDLFSFLGEAGQDDCPRREPAPKGVSG